MANDRAEIYSSVYLADYGFESEMVFYRRQLLLERLNHLRPEVVFEIGCGNELLYETWLNGGGMAECWVTVEPSEKFAELARSARLPNMHVVQACFENAIPRVQSICSRAPNLVICSSVLHEVPSATAVLAAMRFIMGAETRTHINVPNANSLHRRLAKSMALIADTKAMSERNLNLMQNRVYDMASLKADLASAGLSVIDEGGYLLKPFTHAQMERVASELGESVMDGLFDLGRELPELASEIWVEAVRDNG